MAEKEKVVLAYSGGLDTSCCLKWLQVEKNLDVIAICGNVGQDEADLEYIKNKALECGAIASEAMDMREEYASEYLTKALAANGLYENTYPLLSALSRPLLSKHMVEAAHKYGAKYIAHGCTGKGITACGLKATTIRQRRKSPPAEQSRRWNASARRASMVRA